MIDIHTHILPCIDDGARDAETAVTMLRMMKAQGVDLIGATPHYYCLDCTPEEHRANAEKAYGTLMYSWENAAGERAAELPEIRIGAEIYLAESLQAVEKPELLKISGTDLMLFELPFTGFTRWIPAVTELVAAKAKGRPLFAHIDRYIHLYGRRVMDALEALPGAAFQFNSDAFDDRAVLKYMYSLIDRGYAVFFASDCHGAHRRPPDLGERLPVLEKKLTKKFSAEVYAEIVQRQYSLLNSDSAA
ncbi:MAG: hypothetical protein J5584_07825 [Clostridia bacterium]|nr:hypothetical protein [Clostridia bacterium]